jgi:hypothetical protein
MNLSQKDLAKKIGCARSTLSEATNEGYLVKGRWDVQAWAVCGPSGRLKHYEVPDRVAFLNGGSRENPSEDPNPANSSEFGGDSAPSGDTNAPELSILENPSLLTEMIKEKEKTTRTVAEQAGDTTQLVSEETDVEGTARNAGLAYAAGKAIEHEGPGARAFWTVASALAGGFGGYAVSKDEETGEGSPLAALIGAVGLGSVGYLAYGQQPRRQEGVAPRWGKRSGHDQVQSSTQKGRRSAAVTLGAGTTSR